MLRSLLALALLAALVIPGLSLAQSPPVGSPLGTLDEFQGFLTEHGLPLELEPLDTTPTSWGAMGSSGDLEAYALGQADSLVQVNLMVVLPDDAPSERDAGLTAIHSFLEVYAPESSPSVAALDFAGPLDTRIELDDRLVGIIHGTSMPDMIVVAVRLKAAGGLPAPTVPLASTTPSASATA